MAAGFGEQIAYDALVRQMLKIELDKSSRFTDWARRPLSEAQLDLRPGRRDPSGRRSIPMLRERLEKAGRLAWVAEEMAALTDPALYDVDPENAWKRLKPRKSHGQVPGRVHAPWPPGASAPPRPATSRAAASSRTRRSTRSPPRRRPTPTALNRLRSVPKGFAGSRFGAELIEAIREALDDPEAYAPVIERDAAPRRRRPPARWSSCSRCCSRPGPRTPASPPS